MNNNTCHQSCPGCRKQRLLQTDGFFSYFSLNKPSLEKGGRKEAMDIIFSMSVLKKTQETQGTRTPFMGSLRDLK